MIFTPIIFVSSASARCPSALLTSPFAANVKQVLTILFAVSLFDLHITFLNAAGIAITLVGGAWYAWVEYTAKVARRQGVQ